MPVSNGEVLLECTSYHGCKGCVGINLWWKQLLGCWIRLFVVNNGGAIGV